MPAPKRPNTTAATEAAAVSARRRRLLAAAGDLYDAGWLLVAPDHAVEARRSLAITPDGNSVEWRPVDVGVSAARPDCGRQS